MPWLASGEKHQTQLLFLYLQSVVSSMLQIPFNSNIIFWYLFHFAFPFDVLHEKFGLNPLGQSYIRPQLTAWDVTFNVDDRRAIKRIDLFDINSGILYGQYFTNRQRNQIGS